MKNRLLICLLAIVLIAFSVLSAYFIAHQINVYNANKRAESIVIGDNSATIQNADKQTIIKDDDNIGTLTIPDILLENAPINEGIGLDVLSHSIGHFPNTGIYDGNVCFASHNRGSNASYFKNLNKLKVGSVIYYQSIFGTKRYKVVTISNIQETDFSYIQPTSDNRITLITCVANKPSLRLCVQGIKF